MSILDLEPTYDEISNQAYSMFSERYAELVWQRMYTNRNDLELCDMEHAAEQVLIRAKKHNKEVDLDPA